MDIPFVPGRVYSRRKDIHASFGGQRQGGIITPSNGPFIFLVTGDEGVQHGYRDHPDVDGSFRYYGEGQLGDMQFVRGNKAIKDHAAGGRRLLLFRDERGGLRFKGEYRYGGEEILEEPDRTGELRRAIKFRLLPVEGSDQEPSPEETELKSILNPGKQGSPSQFARDAAYRQAIEGHSMNLASRYFERSGFQVEDVHSTSSCDLICRRPGVELRVEVKGSSTGSTSVILTRNELRLALEPGYALFYVANIRVDWMDGQAKASGGTCMLYNPLDLAPSRLEPLAFSVDLGGLRFRRVEHDENVGTIH